MSKRRYSSNMVSEYQFSIPPSSLRHIDLIFDFIHFTNHVFQPTTALRFSLAPHRGATHDSRAISASSRLVWLQEFRFCRLRWPHDFRLLHRSSQRYSRLLLQHPSRSIPRPPLSQNIPLPHHKREHPKGLQQAGRPRRYSTLDQILDGAFGLLARPVFLSPGLVDALYFHTSSSAYASRQRLESYRDAMRQVFDLAGDARWRDRSEQRLREVYLNWRKDTMQWLSEDEGKF